MKKKIIMMTAAMVMGLSSLTLTACTAETAQTTAATAAATEAATIEIASVDALPETTAPVPETTAAMEGGVLIIKVNPEIAVEYDKDGIVTAVTARNNEAIAIINQCEACLRPILSPFMNSTVRKTASPMIRMHILSICLFRSMTHPM